MIRKFRCLGFALMAAFALSALASPMASAAQFTTTAGAELSGSQVSTVQFTVTGQSVTCTTATTEATAPAAAFESMKATGAISGCQTSLGTTVTVTGLAAQVGEAGKCWGMVHANGSGALECNGGDITLDAGPCVTHIPAQSFASGISYSNGTSEGVGDLTAQINVTGIKSTHTDGFLCPFGSSGESTEAVLEGEVTVTASVGGVPVHGSWDK